jgi:hypothetical protein
MLQTMSRKSSAPDSAPTSKVCVLSTGLPHPTDGASTVVYDQYLRALRDDGRDIVLVCLLTSNAGEKAAETARIYQQQGIEVILCCSPEFYKGRFGRYRLDDQALAEVRGKVAECRPDVVLCLDLVAAWVGSELFPRLPRVVWLGDLHFQTYWLHALYTVKEDGMSRAALYNLLRYLVYCRDWRRVYREVLKNDAHVIACNKSSEKDLARLGVRATYAPYPWPQLTEKPASPQPVAAAIPTFVFFGTLQALGSRSALHVLIDEIHPLMVAQYGRGGFKIQICGRGYLYPWAKSGIDSRPELEFLGFVDDLDDLMRRSHALLAPIDVPVGNRTRIVTAMAQRTLVIAHRNAARGNPDLVDGETCFLAATAAEFVERMRMAIEQPLLKAQIIERAYACYLRTFAPLAANAVLVEAMKSAARQRVA